MEITKTCIHCGETKTYEELCKDKRKKDGVIAVCKECNNARKKKSGKYKEYKKRQKKKYAEDSEYRQKVRDKAAKYREEHNENVLLSQAKIRAEKFNLDFNIDLTDIVIPDTCPILGVKLERGTGTKNKNSPSLDRIDNSKGYVKGNVKVISYLANHMKTDASNEELMNFAKNIRKYIENDDIV